MKARKTEDKEPLMKTEGKFERYFGIHARDAMSAEEEAKSEYEVIEGKAVEFNSQTVILSDPDSGFSLRETILPEAFKSTDMGDVILDLNHDTDYPYARSRKKTLDLIVKPDGLYFSAKLWKQDARAMELYKKIKHGDYDQCSFMFTYGKDGYERTRSADGLTVSDTVTNIGKLYDVSVVTFPAYQNTSVDARSAESLDRLKAELDSEMVNAKRRSIMGLCEKALNQGGIKND